MGRLLMVPFVIICLMIVVILGASAISTHQEYGPQGASTYSWGGQVPRDHPFYQLPIGARLIPTVVAGVLIMAIVLGKLSKNQ